MEWPFILDRVLAQRPCVLVTLNLILGSMPRESGSRMIVTAEDVHGSIGGGNLEFTAIGKAREWLAESPRERQMHVPFGLGPALNQCCGGAVTLLFEVLPRARPAWLDPLLAAASSAAPAVLATAVDRPRPLHLLVGEDLRVAGELPADVLDACRQLLASPAPAHPAESAPLPSAGCEGDRWWLERVQAVRIPLVLFGAGHVGREVARLLERLPFAVSWVDARQDAFAGLPAPGMHCVCTADPVQQVAAAPPGSVFVVMTHSHQLDEDICLAVLQRGDFAWLGLIGSHTKRRRFEQRLGRRGIAAGQLQRLVCPIGLDGIRGKQPATIALSLVAQLMVEQPWIRASA